MSKPGNYTLRIYQGADLDALLTWKVGDPLAAVNLTGYTARLHARAALADVATLFELTTENGGIVLGGIAGTIRLLITDLATSALSFEKGVYDLELVSGAGVVTRLLEGRVLLSKEVTR